MKFRTEVDIPNNNPKTGYQDKTMFWGSCFAENIGNKMTELKFCTDVNPFGILYNPESVANGIEILINKQQFTSDMLIRHNELWHSFYHHGKFSGKDVNNVLQTINEKIITSASNLKTCRYLFITFGTAWVYQLKETGQIVSNCHKIPAGRFNRFRLEVDEIVERYKNLIQKLQSVNPQIKIVFTVSPIRHWKDGAVENQLSKSTLILAVQKIVDELSGFCSYFPSYEIVMDELRDYRFYAGDMIHLSDVAIDFIWQKFNAAFIEKSSQNFSLEIQKILNAANHRPFNPNTKQHLNFLEKSLKKLTECENKFPNLNFKLEKKYFTHEIKKIKNNTTTN